MENQQEQRQQPPVQEQPPVQQPPTQQSRPPVQVNTGPDLTELVTKLQALPEQLVNSVREAFPPAAPPAPQQSPTSSSQATQTPPVSQVPPAASAGTPPQAESWGHRARNWWFKR